MVADEDSTVPKIIKDGDTLIIDGDKKFNRTNRNIFLNAKDLQISHSMKDLSDEKNPQQPVFRTSIYGTATIERDLGFGVIGYEDTYAEAISIEIRGSDHDQLKEMSRAREEIIEKKTKKEKLFDISGSEKLYTNAWLGFSPANWEFDIGHQFILSIDLPRDLMRILTEAIQTNTIGGLRVGLEMEGLYTDGYVGGWATMPIRYFLVPNEKEVSTLSMQDMRAPSSAHGYVTALSLSEKKRNFEEFKLPDFLAKQACDESEKSYGHLKSEYAVFLQQVLPRIDALNKSMAGIRKAIWAAVITIAVLALTLL